MPRPSQRAFEWYMARLIVRNGHVNNYEVGICAQNLDTFLGESIANIMGGAYVII